MTRTRYCVLLLCLMLAPRQLRASATDIWVTQNGAGSQNGTSLANAASVSFLSSGGNCGGGSSKVGPGTTIHLSGTFTFPQGAAGIVFMSCSGTSGNPIWLKTEPGFVCQSPAFGWNVGNTTGGCFQVNNDNYIKIGGATPCGTSPGAIPPTSNNCDGTIQNTAYGTPYAFSGFQQSGGIMVTRCTGCEISSIAITNLYVNLAPWPIASISCSNGSCTATCPSACPVGVGILLSFPGNSLIGSNTAKFTVTGNKGGNTIEFTDGSVSGTASGGTAVDESTGSQHNNINSVFSSNDVGLSIHDNYLTNAGWGILLTPPSAPTFNIRFYNNYTNGMDHMFAGGPAAGSNGGAGTTGVYIYGNYFGNMNNWDDSIANNYHHHDGVHLQIDTWDNPQNYFENVYIYNNRFGGNAGTPNDWLFLRASTSNMVIFNNVVGCQNGSMFPDIVGIGDQTYKGSFTTNPALYNNTYTCGAYGGGGAALMWASTATGIMFENNFIASQKYLVTTSAPTAAFSMADYNIYEALWTDSGMRTGEWLFSWPGQNTRCDTPSVCDPNSSMSQNNPAGAYSFQNLIGTGNDNHSKVKTYAQVNLDSNGNPRGGSAMVGAGANLTSLCTGDLVPLCADILGNPRPTSGAWNIGAYQAGQNTSAPAAPEGLAATVTDN